MWIFWWSYLVISRIKVIRIYLKLFNSYTLENGLVAESEYPYESHMTGEPGNCFETGTTSYKLPNATKKELTDFDAVRDHLLKKGPVVIATRTTTLTFQQD